MYKHLCDLVYNLLPLPDEKRMEPNTNKTLTGIRIPAASVRCPTGRHLGLNWRLVYLLNKEMEMVSGTHSTTHNANSLRLFDTEHNSTTLTLSRTVYIYMSNSNERKSYQLNCTRILTSHLTSTSPFVWLMVIGGHRPQITLDTFLTFCSGLWGSVLMLKLPQKGYYYYPSSLQCEMRNRSKIYLRR